MKESNIIQLELLLVEINNKIDNYYAISQNGVRQQYVDEEYITLLEDIGQKINGKL